MKPEEKESKIFKSTMEELGPNLPMGFKDASGGYITALAAKPWTMKAEKEVGKLRDKSRGSNVASYLTMILSEMCSSIGPHNLEGKDATEKQILVSQMLAGDVFYTYMWLRKEAMGKDIRMKIECPTCREEFDFYADLNTIEVNRVKDLSDLDVEYTLRDPIEIRSKKVDKFLLGPMYWSTYEMMNKISVKNPGAAKEGILLGSIKKCNPHEGNITLIESELDDLSKHDMENVVQIVSDNSIGPDMSIEGVHEKCGGKFEHGIDWSYDNFFGNSSR